eukprot:scaffold28774_cov15-Tisochrysis_lutea.AAC.2
MSLYLHETGSLLPWLSGSTVPSHGIIVLPCATQTSVPEGTLQASLGVSEEDSTEQAHAGRRVDI